MRGYFNIRIVAGREAQSDILDDSRRLRIIKNSPLYEIGEDRGTSYKVYVVELNSKSWTDNHWYNRSFRRKNPQYKENTKPYVYVGSTIYEPEERYHKHLNREFPADCAPYMMRPCGLLYPFFYCFNPMPNRVTAERIEKAIAEKLRNLGYAAWQG